MIYISEYLANAFLDSSLGGGAFPSLGTIQVGLYKALPLFSTAVPASEVSGGSYVRQNITFGTAADDGMKINTAKVTFPSPTADWATAAAPIVAAVILNGGGTQWLYASDICPLIVLNGDTAPVIEIGGYKVFLGTP